MNADSSNPAPAEHCDVIVVGAGLVGAAFAALLADADPDVKVVVLEARVFTERYEGDRFDPRVVALSEVSRRILEQAGVWRAVASRRISPYRGMTVWEADGTGRVEFDSEELGRADIGHIVENSVIVSALLERLEGFDNVRLLCPATVTDLKLDGGGATVELDDGHRLAAPLLVAADGAHSHTRELAGFATREWDYGHHAIVATVRMAREHGGVARQRFAPQGPLALLPLRGDDGDSHWISIVWSQDEARAAELMALDDETFAAALTRESEACLGPVVQVDRRYCLPLRQRHATDYVRPGVALIGDAAHTIHPLAGQGVNLGFQDVEVLCAEVLRARGRGVAAGHATVLQRYQRRRKADNLAMMAAMEAFKRLFAADGASLRLLRNQGMSLFNDLPPLKRAVMRRAMGL